MDESTDRLRLAIEELSSEMARPMDLINQTNDQLRLVLEKQAAFNNQLVEHVARR